MTDTYSQDVWRRVVRRAELQIERFEALVLYDDILTERVLAAVTAELDKPLDIVLEDLGNYLVSHENLEALRRLLRFGGVTFVEFLHSLDDMHDRAKLAVPDLELPHLELHEVGSGVYRLECRANYTGFGHVMVGILRSMADDYGDLVYLEHAGSKDGVEAVMITLLETQFAEGRSFELSAKTGA